MKYLIFLVLSFLNISRLISMELNDNFVASSLTEDRKGEERLKIFYYIQENDVSSLKSFLESKKIELAQFTNAEGFSPLRYAAFLHLEGNNRLEVIDLLIKNGANINERDKETGGLLMMRAFPDIKLIESSLELIKLFVENGVDTMISDKKGETIGSLVQKGVDVYLALAGILNEELLTNKAVCGAKNRFDGGVEAYKGNPKRQRKID